MQEKTTTESNIEKRMKQFYETSEVYKGFLEAHDELYLRSYIELVDSHAKPDSFILELGCGNGLSARMLRDKGHQVIGIDLSSTFLEKTNKWEDESLKYLACSAINLPFKDQTFDLVCSNEMLEHVTDAEKSLTEMVRVVKPGGKIIVAGPNLCSPFLPLFDLFRILSGKNELSVWADTKCEAIKGIWKNFWLLTRKRITKKIDFLYREPELEERVIGGDADSVYYANPIDLEKFFKFKGLKIIKLAVGYGIKGKIMAKFFPRFGLYVNMILEK